MGAVRVGTSGWSYPEWVGPFYPAGTSTSRMLPYYAERFRTVEAHNTHRRLPTPAALTRWLAQVPAGFRFAPKAHVGITHRRDLEGVAERMDAFLAALRPLGDALGPVLFVLPHRHPDLARLDALLDALPGPSPESRPPIVFELGPEWWTDDVLARLSRYRAALAVVDRDAGTAASPTAPAISSARVAYARLRRSRYTPDELDRWAARLVELAAPSDREVYAFLKHDDLGDGPRYAQALVERLERLEQA